MAAAALKAAGNEQGWIRFGKKPKKLDDPLQVTFPAAAAQLPALQLAAAPVRSTTRLLQDFEPTAALRSPPVAPRCPLPPQLCSSW